MSTRSYNKVQYDLRPAKQAERRMLVDAFQLLSDEGFTIRDYQYTGMGSIHFVDFILFHRFLGLSRLLSVERDVEIERRVKFNKPFDAIDVVIGDIADEIGKLSNGVRHIVWLDYDDVLRREFLECVAHACATLPLESILLVTIDADSPGPEGTGPAEWMEHFRTEAGDVLDQPLEIADFGYSKLASLCVRCLVRTMEKTLSQRQDVSLIPLFNFSYADGHQMITIGAMLGGESQVRRIRASALSQTEYYRSDFEKEPFVISVPKLTRRERIHLDGFMPCKPEWMPSEFELDPADVAAYRSVYRFLPAYGELLW